MGRLIIASCLTATLTRDTTAPTVVSVDSAASKPTGAAKVDYVITFSEPITGVDISDLHLRHDQGGGSSVQNVSGSGSTYAVTVAIGFRSGTLRLEVLGDGTIEDRAANPLGDGFTTDAPVAVGPLALTAPFALQEAQQAQKAWAECLETPVALTNSIGMRLVFVPPGEFQMGVPSRALRHLAPLHSIRITKPFYLAATEVTQEQWESVMRTKPWIGHSFGWEWADLAASWMSWDDAQEFCRRLSEKEGVTYRLPTEAEWEYACRAGTTSAFSFGDDASRLGEYAWFRENVEDIGGRLGPRPVGQKKPNAFGLYDMHGNVGEWCQDYYGKDYYASSPRDDPPGPLQGSTRVWRGGNWDRNSRQCESWWRCNDEGNGTFEAGLRVARSAVR